ncbi:MAG: glycosyltransferase family 2 protein [Candidatus Bathyarchaeia archaeon]
MDVFIPTWNNERSIGKCLASIRSEIPDAAITIVDNFSSDDTVNIAKAYGAKVVQQHLNLGEARTWICKNAVGEWFIMIDSDAYLPKNWYSKMLHWRDVLAKQDDKLGAICNRVYEMPIIKDPATSKLFKKGFLYNLGQLPYLQKNVGRFQPNGALFKTEAVRGFNTHAAALEDMLIGRYIVSKGFNTYVVPVYILHEQLLDKENMLKRARIMGAWWNETHYTSLVALCKNAFLAACKVPFGTKIWAFKIYIHHIVGWLTKEQYLKNYRWSKG